MWSWLSSLFEQPPTELVAAHKHVRTNMRYKTQGGEWKAGKVLTVHTSVPFDGDCDDHAATVAFMVGGDYAEINNNTHAVCIYRGWVSDNNRKSPYKHSKDFLPNRRFSLEEAKRYGYKVKYI